MRVAADPGLYDPENPLPTLHGSRCDACGTTFFPPLGIGCEICGAGAEGLRAVPLAAAGTLHSLATVYVHAGEDIEAPFTVAEVQLDDGPLIRGLMSEPATIDAIGSRVAAQWAELRTDADGNDVVEPRFRIEDRGDAGGGAA
ncbi:MAG: OB-fold domain-containing protein [Alphaproteobacteria bacterium]|jgi:hypothetical protein|nr:OB-fold domain-containing protein [Alphaproteobacteria bacterium]MDP6812193.1 OB-fold domain-containing protein [Alphaproteobacteria bacterium]